MKKDNLRQEGQEFKGDLGSLVKPSPRERRGRGGRGEDSRTVLALVLHCCTWGGFVFRTSLFIPAVRLLFSISPT